MEQNKQGWIGKMPSSWNIVKGKYLFVQRNERGNDFQLQLLSPTQKYGCIPQSLYEELTGANTVKLNDDTDLNFLKTIHEGDYCISLRSFQGGFEYCPYEGVVSPAYQVFYPIKELCKGYYKYLFKDEAFIAKMNTYTLSLRDGKNIAFSDFGNTFLLVPPLAEQERIAAFLDAVTTKIDKAITEAKELIEKYKAYKRSVISEAVTKGLDKNAKMKDSGKDWIGYIPSKWTIKRAKYVLWERNERSLQGTEEPLTMSQKYGLIPTKDFGEVAHSASTFIGAKIVHEKDLVFNKLKAHLGVFSVSCNFGVVSPDYAVYNTSTANIKFIEYLFKTPMYIKEFRKRITGVGAGLSRLYTSDLFSIHTIFPPLSEQEQIADYLDRKCAVIDKMIEKKETLIEELQRYRKSVIYEYVTGKKQVAE